MPLRPSSAAQGSPNACGNPECGPSAPFAARLHTHGAPRGAARLHTRAPAAALAVWTASRVPQHDADRRTQPAQQAEQMWARPCGTRRVALNAPTPRGAGNMASDENSFFGLKVPEGNDRRELYKSQYRAIYTYKMSAQDLDQAFREAVTADGPDGGWSIKNDERVKYVGKLEVAKGEDSTLKVRAPEI